MSLTTPTPDGTALSSEDLVGQSSFGRDPQEQRLLVLAEPHLSENTVSWLSGHGFLDPSSPFAVDQFKDLHRFAVSSDYQDDKFHKEEERRKMSTNPGCFRTVNYRNRAAFRMGVDPDDIEDEMQTFVNWLNTTEREASFDSVSVFAAESYIRAIDIHPVLNGNGRTFRLFLNTMRVRHGEKAADLTLINWHNPRLVGCAACLPHDAKFLGSLIDDAALGKNTHDYSRYLNADGSVPRKLCGNELKKATPAEVLTAYRSNIGCASPGLRLTREILSRVNLDSEQKIEFLNILAACVAKVTHSVQATEQRRLLEYFRSNIDRY